MDVKLMLRYMEKRSLLQCLHHLCLRCIYSRINFMQFGGKIVVCVFLLTHPEAVFGLAASPEGAEP